MRFSVLDVGQGSGNYIEYFAGGGTSGTPTAAILVDLGTSQGREELGVPSANWVAERIRKMNRPWTLAAVILSHPDRDHVNLIDALLSKFAVGELTINEIWYGGDRHHYIKPVGNAQYDYLAALDSYRPGLLTAIRAPGLAASGFPSADPATWQPIATLGPGNEVKVYLLIGNTAYHGGYTSALTQPTPPVDGYKSNSSSLVLVVNYAGQNIVVTGDATGLTMARASEIIERAKVPLNALSLTLPHHGSFRSAYDMKGIARDLNNLPRFAKNVGARTISASAWEFSVYRHPHIEIINAFSTYLNRVGIDVWEDPSLGNSEHFVTAYLPQGSETLTGGTTATWPSDYAWHSMRTAVPVFTNDYFKTDDKLQYPVVSPPSRTIKYQPAFFFAGSSPARAKAWAFEVDGANLKIRPVMDKGTLAALPPTHPLRLAIGPLPEEDEFVILPVGAPAQPPQPPPIRSRDHRPSTNVPPRPPGRLRTVG